MLDEEKLPYLIWRPSSLTLADLVITKCVPTQLAECLVPFVGLVWCTYPIVLWMRSSLTVIR